MVDFEVIFVDVGEGDSTLIKLPDGRYALVDVFRCEDHGTVDLHRLLDDRLPDGANGKKRLDYLIITHAHDDHIRGLGELYDRYDVGELWLPQHGYKEAPGDQYADFERVEEEHPDEDTYWPKGSRSPIRYLGENDEVTVRCFSPPGYITVEEELDEDEARRLVHENCMVLKFEYQGGSVLLTGDSNLPCWQRVQGYYEGQGDENNLEVLKADVLHASHHGSRTFVKNDKADDPWLEALEVIDPDYVLISVGKNNKHEHPHDDMMEVYRDHVGGQDVLETQTDETIVMQVDADGTYTVSADGGEFRNNYGWDDDGDGDDGGDARGGTPPPPPPPSRPRRKPDPDSGRSYG
jgi:competence protein ComEC